MPYHQSKSSYAPDWICPVCTLLWYFIKKCDCIVKCGFALWQNFLYILYNICVCVSSCVNTISLVCKYVKVMWPHQCCSCCIDVLNGDWLMCWKCLLQSPLQLTDVHKCRNGVLQNGIDLVTKEHVDMDRKLTDSKESGLSFC